MNSSIDKIIPSYNKTSYSIDKKSLQVEFGLDSFYKISLQVEESSLSYHKGANSVEENIL